MMPTNEQAQQILRKSLRIVLIVAIPVVGFFVGGYIGSLSSGSTTQSDLTWQTLGMPPDKPIKLLGLCDKEICVETRNGQQYRYDSTACNQSAKSACWEADSSKVIEPIVPQFYDTCTFSIDLPVPPIETVQLLGAKICGSGSDEYIYYALLYDGSVWKWEDWINGANQIDELFSVITGALIGLVTGIIIAIFIFVREWHLANRTTEQAQS
jgi:hypothetical protein